MLFTPEYERRRYNSLFIRSFVRNEFQAKWTGSKVQSRFKVAPFEIYFDGDSNAMWATFNPLEQAVEHLAENKHYAKQKGLHSEINFLDPAFLIDNCISDFERVVWSKFEEGKDEACNIFKTFLAKGFHIPITQLKVKCTIYHAELVQDFFDENSNRKIKKLSKPFRANFGETDNLGSLASRTVTALQKSRGSRLRPTRTLYLKNQSIIRYERKWGTKEIEQVNVISFNAEDFRTFFQRYKDDASKEFQELIRLSDFEPDEEEQDLKAELILWLWKCLLSVKIPAKLFYLFATAIETDQIDTRLFKKNYHLRDKLLESGAFVESMELKSKQKSRYLRLNKELFRQSLI